MSASPVTFSDVAAAADRIAPFAVRTPLLSSPALDGAVGARVLLKPENLQRTGSFKFRGAMNRLLQLSEAEREAGVVAWSSGNHAQGIAAAAELLGIEATIVMPLDAPAIKTEKTLGYGARIVAYDRTTESREEIAHQWVADHGSVLVPSFEDSGIIAGQGTCGLEIAQDVDALGRSLDALLICCGGGGLTAGISLALSELSSSTAIYSVEPAGFDDHARSLLSGEREMNDPAARSICDALLAPSPGEMTFSINRDRLAGGLVVTDDEVEAAMRFAFRELKLVVEPGGAVALAAVLSGKIDRAGRTIGVVLSGGNVDGALFSEVLARG